MDLRLAYIIFSCNGSVLEKKGRMAKPEWIGDSYKCTVTSRTIVENYFLVCGDSDLARTSLDALLFSNNWLPLRPY